MYYYGSSSCKHVAKQVYILLIDIQIPRRCSLENIIVQLRNFYSLLKRCVASLLQVVT